MSDSERRRWAGFAIGMWMALLSGTAYGFSSFETQLKNHLHFGQKEIETVGVALHIGMYLFKPLSGHVFDKFGPRVSALVAAVATGVGYSVVGILCLTADSKGSNASLIIAILSFLTIGVGSGLGYITTLSTNAKNFAGVHRGKVMGALASMFGLSASMVSAAYSINKTVHASLASFFFVMGVLVVSAYLAGSVLLRPMLSLIDPTPLLDPESESSLATTPVLSGKDGIETEDTTFTRQHASASLVSLASENPGFWVRNHGIVPVVWELVKELRFWLLYILFALGTGCGLFLINNLGLIVESLSLKENSDLVQLLVILLAIFGCLGRVAIGYLSDIAPFPRTVFLSLCLGVCGLTLLASSLIPAHSQNTLIATVFGVGIAYGGIWVIISTLLSELYGMANFGKVYGVFATAPALSSTAFNSIASVFYENHEEHGSETCYGQDCYRESMVLFGCLGVIAAVFSIAVFRFAKY